MKSRIGAALVITASVAAGTLGLTGTATAQAITAPATGSAQVKCDDNGRARLVVTAKNNSGQTANIRVRSQYGNDRDRNVAAGATATIEIATGQSNVRGGSVDVVTRVNGVRQSSAPFTYTGKDCTNNRRPQITVAGRDGNNNGRLNRVLVTNDGNRRITVRVVANGQVVTHNIDPGRQQPFVLNDTARFASVIAINTGGGNQNYTFRIVRA